MSDAGPEQGQSVRLIDRRLVADGTMAFTFEKPTGFTFTAGQFVELTLPQPTEEDPAGHTRALSLASAPEESTLMVATRLRDTPFKRALQRMPFGTTLSMEGPYGSLTLPADPQRPVVMLAGGIGITPFRSMIVHEAAQRSSRRLVLLYANRRPDDAAFLDECRLLASLHPPFTLVGTISQLSTATRGWQGETGHITAAMLAAHTRSLASPLYYLVGPPAMVVAMRTMLQGAQIAPSDIRTEAFAGY